MSVRMEKLPPLRTVLAVLDTSARSSASAAGRRGVSAVRRVMPARTRRLQQGFRATTSRTSTGYSVELRPRKNPAYPGGVTPIQVFRWVSGGTGVYAGKGPIRARRGHAFTLPGGVVVDSIRGQRPQRILERASGEAESLARRELEDVGPRRAAARMESAFAGGGR